MIPIERTKQPMHNQFGIDGLRCPLVGDANKREATHTANETTAKTPAQTKPTKKTSNTNQPSCFCQKAKHLLYRNRSLSREKNSHSSSPLRAENSETFASERRALSTWGNLSRLPLVSVFRLVRYSCNGNLISRQTRSRLACQPSAKPPSFRKGKTAYPRYCQVPLVIISSDIQCRRLSCS